MVQNVTNQGQNNYGAITKIGTSQDGRAIYQVNSPNGQVAGRLSVAAADCDKFEKSYQQIMEVAPKLQEYAANTTPEKMEKKKKKASWGIGIMAVLGAGVSIYLTRNAKIWKQALTSLAGGFAGLTCGSMIARKILVPPGAKELSEATKTLQTLDVKPLQ